MKPIKYLQIVQNIKEKIKDGEWPVGSRIPSQRQLALDFGVNRSTVVTALEELTADGLIEGKTGIGTIVVNNTWTLFGGNLSPAWNENIHSGAHRASSSLVKEINESESDNRLIQLSKGELSPDMFPLQKMKSIIRHVSSQLTPFGYEEPKGNRQLREAVSFYLQKKGISVSSSSILIVSGALQALQLVSAGLLKNGSTVYLEQPSYLQSLSIFQSAGAQLKGVPVDKKGIDLNAMRKEKTEPGHSILYTNPTFHNPTGTLMEAARRKTLIDICREKQLPIIEDDVYRELWLDDIPPPPLKTFDKYGSILYMGSFSKSLSPGLRIGWMTGPEAVIDRLADLKMQTDYGSSSLSQYIATEWLAGGHYEDHLIHVRQELQKRREICIRALTEHLSAFADWTVPSGGFFIWIRLAKAINARSLYSQAGQEGILLNPGSIYAEPSGHYIRISYAYASWEDLQKGIKRLAEIIAKNEGKHD